MAYLNVFDTVNGNGGGAAGDGYGYMQPAWVFPHKLGDSPKNIAEAVSHEVGPQLRPEPRRQRHARATTRGHGAWAPIMGVGYDHPISQWSKGDYAGANNTSQDDVAIISGVTGARTDEAGDQHRCCPGRSSGHGVHLRAAPTWTPTSSARAPVSVTVNAVADTFANLDIQVTLLNAVRRAWWRPPIPPSGQTTPSVASGMSASVTQTLSSGTYYASVDGVGNGPWSTGYDDYGSLGAYTLAATGCDGAAPTGTPSAPTSTAATPHASDPTVTVTWAAPTTAGTECGHRLRPDAQRQRRRRSRSGRRRRATCGPGWSPSTAYSFTVTALNAQGPRPAVTVSATDHGRPPTRARPQNVTGQLGSLGQRGLLGWTHPREQRQLPPSPASTSSSTASVIGQRDVTPSGITNLTPGTSHAGSGGRQPPGAVPSPTRPSSCPPRPANDAFAQRTTLPGVSGTIAGDNLAVVRGASAGEPAPPQRGRTPAAPRSGTPGPHPRPGRSR